MRKVQSTPKLTTFFQQHQITDLSKKPNAQGGMMSSQQVVKLTKDRKSHSLNALDMLHTETNTNLAFMNIETQFVLESATHAVSLNAIECFQKYGISKEAPELYSGEISNLNEDEKDLGACLVTPFEGMEEISWIEEIKEVFKRFLASGVIEEVEEQIIVVEGMGKSGLLPNAMRRKSSNLLKNKSVADKLNDWIKDNSSVIYVFICMFYLKKTNHYLFNFINNMNLDVNMDILCSMKKKISN